MEDNKPRNKPKRKHLLAILTLVFLGAGAGWGAWWYLHGRFHETTDDAYVAGNLVRVTPRIAGTVVAVLADDTDHVKQGQVLVRLDDADARVALDKAEADLAQTVRQVRQMHDTVNQSQANLVLKQEAVDQAKADLARRVGAAADQSISKEELAHARTALAKAQAEQKLAAAQLSSARAQVAGTTVMDHPAVLRAAARVREAYLADARCEIRAPEAGYVAKRNVQVGQQVAAGAPLMAIVPLHQLWVEANFKEDQLRRLRIGQPVELVSDLYGGSVDFHGKVVGLSAGTGGAFALLPPQNASGNWIKIVQRVPVRVALEPTELAKHPLRVGLSMKADVDTHDLSGPVLATGEPLKGYVTPVYAGEFRTADKLVHDIIDANRAKR